MAGGQWDGAETEVAPPNILAYSNVTLNDSEGSKILGDRKGLGWGGF